MYPYLFILANEGLILLIHNAIALKDIARIKVARTTVISRLFYVDDVLLFGQGSVVEWRSYKVIINLFYKALGLDIIFKKSCFIYASVDEETRRYISDIFGYKQVDFLLSFK